MVMEWKKGLISCVAATALLSGCSSDSNDDDKVVDNPPAFTESLADISRYYGEPNFTVSFEAKDPDESAVTYSAKSSDESIATVNVDGANVRQATISLKSAGQTTITITASSEGKSVHEDFILTVNPSTAYNGIVADPAIRGAVVSLWHKNANGNYEALSMQATTDENGAFNLYVPDGMSDFKIRAVGGVDRVTSEDFTGLALEAPLALFSGTNTVISPVTTLVVNEMKSGSDINSAIAAVKTKVGDIDPKLNPETNAAVQAVAMRLTTMAKGGKSFDEVAASLDGDGMIGESDVNALYTDSAEQAKMKQLVGGIDESDLRTSYIKMRYARHIASTIDGFNYDDNQSWHNLLAVADEMIKGNDGLSAQEISQNIANVGPISNSAIAAADFSPAPYKQIASVGTGTFDDTLNIMFYELDNPETGNTQLIAYDQNTRKAQVVKNDVIMGDRTFVYSGSRLASGAVRYDARKYGFYLDPNAAEPEERTYTYYGQPVAYMFYPDNAIKRFDVASPSQEMTFFDSSMIPASVSDKVSKIGAEYSMMNNILDAENSYLLTEAYEELADPNRDEDPEEKVHTWLTIRLKDSAVVKGVARAIINGSDGTTSKVVVQDMMPHKKSDDSSVKQVSLKVCEADLSSCSAVEGASGKYLYATKNTSHLYFYKQGSNKLWAMDKSTPTAALTEVSGVSLAGTYDHDRHAKGSVHGGSSKINGFNALSGANKRLSDGGDGYVAFHYDLTTDKIGKTGTAFYNTSVYTYKHAQVFKLTGNSGVKIFDNGDGSDDIDETTEKVAGHLNLIAIANGKLFMERGWYDGNKTLNPDSVCDEGSFSCTNVGYGYVSTSADAANAMTTLKEKTGLPYYVSRRIAPFASDGNLYVSVFDGGSKYSGGYRYKLFTYNTADVAAEAVERDGRTFFAPSSEATSGMYTGNVVVWDSKSGTITNVSNGKILGNDVINGRKAGSVSTETNGVPVGGFGNIMAMKNDTGSHQFQLFTVDLNEAGSLHYVDFAPAGGWIYE